MPTPDANAHERAALAASLRDVGVIQYGRFATPQGVFQPVQITLGYLPSYPSLLVRLAHALADGLPAEGVTRLLPMPLCLPLGVVIAIHRDLPMVYPNPENLTQIEGAYDYNVPTVLLSGVLTDGAAETALIQQVRRDGLEVRAVSAVFRLGRPLGIPGAEGDITPRALFTPEDIIAATPTERMGSAVRAWLEGGEPF
ncbi:MAG TPA: hypothetical protein PLD47_10900 [Aggregatilineales bacterium]|nr:hypothetical protein [Anaerolineales bacterium]HRE48223.1 hypothetical protein [Aggregatilineales bacterium]